MTGFTYPTGLYDLVRRKWNIKRWEKEVVPVIPDKEIFQNMIDTVYHASFLTEESRRMWFRVVYISPKEVEEIEKIPISIGYDKTIIKFDKPRIFDVNELLKLAPAADPTQVLIGVYNRLVAN